ncbi:signal transduction histidine kinase [Candidatus Scalindua japonica]|uniref:histidine kinase n=1 Tax=Candidatus Scalindua japonica TaxID=1284222 RepID=A0A286U1P5_9BACT|nr:histidine kinase dimerization/phospho-acceptor domain-containing protein [Candidatus Scalindua japonica]GAX62054.1 signal transduction histidine kinase [Candidatus Scalindua japonica]
MSREPGSSCKKLEEYRRTLEQKVEEMALELREANKKLLEADRTKLDFLSVVSHELKTPLAAILGYAKILNKRLNEVIFPNVKSQNSKVDVSTGKVKNGLKTIISEGQRLTELINDLIAITTLCRRITFCDSGLVYSYCRDLNNNNCRKQVFKMMLDNISICNRLKLVC